MLPTERRLPRSRGLRKTQEPCPGCGLHLRLCMCHLIPKLELKTKVSLIVHARELKRTTNTGVLALRALVNSEMKVRGVGRSALDLSSLLSGIYRTLLFFPSERAVELTADFVAQSPLPIQLIVPDGNWRQAAKVHLRHPELAEVTHVTIQRPNLDPRHLRAESSPNGMATLQAIAHALRIIEGEEVFGAMYELYQQKLERTLVGRRGAITSSHC